MYNNYKHGFRLALLESGDPENNNFYPVTMWPIQMIVRWDNAPHYPELREFPHHKYEGKTVIGSTDMTIHMVLKQLEKLVASNSSS